jgi:hypothetical protein
MKKSNLSLTDTVGFEAGLILNGFATMISLKILAGKTIQLTQLFKRLSEINALLKIDDSKINKISSCDTLT